MGDNMKIETLKKGDRVSINMLGRKVTVVVNGVSPDNKIVYTSVGPMPAENLKSAVKV